MAIRTTTLSRDKKSAAWKARKAIPSEIRDTYAAQFGPRYEAKFSTSPDTSERDARALFAQWHADIEARFATLRAAGSPAVGAISHKRAHELAGVWCRDFIELWKDEPGRPEDWQLALVQLGELGEAGGPRQLVLDTIAKSLRVDAFLTAQGLALATDGRNKLIEAMIPAATTAYTILAKWSCGDYQPHKALEKFPAPERRCNLTPFKLFESYALTKKPARNTVIRWRSIFQQINDYFPGQSADNITEADARAWRDSLRARLSAKSINQGYVVAAKAVFNWAVTEGKLSSNPFACLKASKTSKPTKTREKSFRDSELSLILNASLQPPPQRMKGHHVAARRWVPWLCAYSGARPGEICQLRKEDVIQVCGKWALRLTPDAGTIKDKEARIVPLHEHLIAQGFVEFVQSQPTGPLFYNPSLLRKTDNNPADPRRHPAEKTRMRLADWVREVGVKDPDINPMHAFRNTWKTQALHAGIDKVVRDFVQGHAPETIGDAYTQLEGERGFEILSREMAKFPRYIIKTAEPLTA